MVHGDKILLVKSVMLEHGLAAAYADAEDIYDALLKALPLRLERLRAIGDALDSLFELKDDARREALVKKIEEVA